MQEGQFPPSKYFGRDGSKAFEFEFTNWPLGFSDLPTALQTASCVFRRKIATYLKLKLQICTATVYFLTDGVLVLTVFSWTGPAEHFKYIGGQAYLVGVICPPNLDWNRVYIPDRIYLKIHCPHMFHQACQKVRKCAVLLISDLRGCFWCNYYNKVYY